MHLNVRPARARLRVAQNGAQSHLRPFHYLQLLEALADDGDRSQRELAKLLGVALGHANQLLQSLSASGWVRRVPRTGQRVRYEVTARGLAARSRLGRLHIKRCAESYEELRSHVERRLSHIARTAGPLSEVRFVFYGRGILSEVGCVCARNLGVRLLGVVDEGGGGHLLNVPCFTVEAVRGGRLAGEAFDRIVIMSLERSADIRMRLRAEQVPVASIASL